MFQPFLKSFSLPRGPLVRNRMVVAAMTNLQSEEDGRLHDRELTWLNARAQGGFGVVTTCAAHVSLDGQGWPGELGVYDDAMLPGLTRLAQTLKGNGAMVWAQLFHGGVRAPSSVTGLQPWSASAVDLQQRGVEVPRAATEEDIRRTIQNFAAAAARCEQAGMDGVELHGAHGYLLSQFLGTVTNQRTDQWGGSLENRARFVMEIFDAVRASVSDSFIVGIRLSPEVRAQGVTLEESLKVAQWLGERGVDFVHASLWDAFKPVAAANGMPLTTLFRDVLSEEVPLIVTGGVWTPDQALQVMDQGADLVGLGRAAIGNPNWPIHARQPDFEPEMPPFSEDDLRSKGLSDGFVQYMKRWKGFVAVPE